VSRFPTLARLSLALILLTGTVAAQDDIIFRAMQDELDRSMDELQIEAMAAPYFLAYRVLDLDTYRIAARYGAVVEREREHQRDFYIECRVGDPQFDNSGFIASWRDLYDWRDGLVEEDNYGALRHQIWLLTDEAYKNALERLAQKHAYLQAHPPKDTLLDLTPVEPYRHAGRVAALTVDGDAWEADVRAAARALRAFPELQDWDIAFSATGATRRYVNSEGSRHVKGAVYRILEASATAQAADGQRVSTFRRFIACGGDQPPRGAALVAEIEAMATELTATVAAPALDEYAGPILFTDFAAAQFVSQLFAAQLSPTRTPLSPNEWVRDQLPSPKLVRRVNRRVFPPFVRVVDDPRAEAWNGVRLAGHMPVDDEGVPAQRITLVKEGRLRTLPMSRQPSKKITTTNGHAFTFPNQWTAPVITNLQLESETREAELVAELREICRDFDLEFGLLVKRLEDPGIARRYRWTDRQEPGETLLTAPTALYRVFAEDGRIEPVRGLVFDEVSIRALRDLVATGTSSRVYNLRQELAGEALQYYASIMTPDLLIEEMELKSGGAHEPLPIMAAPFAAAR